DQFPGTFTGVQSPVGGAGNLAAWTGTPTTGGTYRITLTGCEFVAGTNSNPVITVVRAASGTPVSITSGSGIGVPVNSTVADLDLQFSVTDINTGDTLSLNATVTGTTISGFTQAEWDAGPSATQPLTAGPTSGAFDNLGVITVVLDADDGTAGGSAQFTFTIYVE